MAYAPSYDSTGVQHWHIPSFTFTCGTTLENVRIAYRIHEPSTSPGITPTGTVLIPTCFAGLINDTLTFTTNPSPSSSSSSSSLAAPLAAYRVIVVALLGNGESASPSNTRGFPPPGQLRYADAIHAQHRLLTQHLGVTRLAAVVGFSMGGQQAYHWAALYPDFVAAIVPVCSSARTSPHNYAFLEGPVEALLNSVDYVAWRALKDEGEKRGVLKSQDELAPARPVRGLRAFGRAYAAWLTSAPWFRERWWGNRPDGGLGFDSVEAWLSNDGDSPGWDADDLLVLARMWQMGDISRAGGPAGEEDAQGLTQLGYALPTPEDDERYARALGGLRAKVLAMPCRTDQYFPPEDSEVEVGILGAGRGTLAVIESVWGHMAGGGIDREATAWMGEKIREFLREGEA